MAAARPRWETPSNRSIRSIQGGKPPQESMEFFWEWRGDLCLLLGIFLWNFGMACYVWFFVVKGLLGVGSLKWKDVMVMFFWGRISFEIRWDFEVIKFLFSVEMHDRNEFTELTNHIWVEKSYPTIQSQWNFMRNLFFEAGNVFESIIKSSFSTPNPSTPPTNPSFVGPGQSQCALRAVASTKWLLGGQVCLLLRWKNAFCKSKKGWFSTGVLQSAVPGFPVLDR